MKRTVFFLIFVLIAASLSYGQGRDFRRAERNINRGNLKDAMEHLESAREHESVKEDPQYWMLMAMLHIEIAITEEEEYQNLAENPVDIADEALHKAMELDADNEYILEIQQSMLFLSELVFNVGVDAYNDAHWKRASDYFYRAFEINKTFDTVDTTTLYNAALSAELGQYYDEAMKMYIDLKEMQYDQPYLYSSLSNIAMTQGDTLAATEYIQAGRDRYPDDLDLIFSEANIHIFTGDTQKAREILDIAIEKDPENPGLYFAFAANYDRMAQDTLYTDEERQFAFDEAVKAYEKAIELEPDYFDAVYNLGVMYFNKGIRIYEEADERLRETHDFARYEEDEKEFRQAWLEAQPYLEYAKELIDEDDPNFRIVVISLVELYARTNQPDKLKEIEEIYLKYFGDEVEEQEQR